MSEAEEFSRMSELAEVSDEEDYDIEDPRCDDIPEAVEDLDENELLEQDHVINKELEPSDAVAAMKLRSKP